MLSDASFRAFVRTNPYSVSPKETSEPGLRPRWSRSRFGIVTRPLGVILVMFGSVIPRPGHVIPSTESTIAPEWPPGYLDAFEPSPWLLGCAGMGSSGRHQSTISHRHISRMGRMLMPERMPPKRDATGSRRLSGYCGYGAMFSRFCQKISRLRLLREFGCRHLICQMIFGRLSDLRRGIGKFPDYFPDHGNLSADSGAVRCW
jgi:hypothetical protein